ncbi:hypothetical protein [Mucilaginibacter panaciglaebae]|uniref:Uncharacterized protein n=1 Tax=Mucilaginibacter panaciglaebae TaxID=502331 RepID=A0ABP7WGH5_9SPHI
MKYFFVTILLALNTLVYPQKQKSLIPSTPSRAGDYFCTWNIQGYLSSYLSSPAQRAEMTGANMFGHGKFQNWVSFYPKIRKDMTFVMDDSWDIPVNEDSRDNQYLGMVEVNATRFPLFTGTPAGRMKKLVQAVKAAGWKGLGGWICAQEAPVAGTVDPKTYWTERLNTANESGFAYWKVDWGKQSRNADWRKMLTQLGRQYAPNLVIEHATDEHFISIGDAYRTYDVENIIAQPTTIARIAHVLKYKPTGDAKSIINCEDEPYIAAGLGCAIGVMRHPFVGNLPNGTIDFVFPPVGRNLKLRLDEVVRGVRWHRIAEPFGIGSDNYQIDNQLLKDKWTVGYRDTWGSAKVGDTLKASAPARVSRGLPLPLVSATDAARPFVLSSRYANGAIAIATIGRGLNHEYVTEKITIEQHIPDINHPIGIFGDYASLTLVLPQNIKADDYKIWGQDLAGETPIDITKKIIVQNNRITLPGDVIRMVGLSAKTKGDLSDPGLVVKFIRINNHLKISKYL